MAQQDQPILNTTKIEELVSLYKVPLLLAASGAVLFLVAIVLLVKTQRSAVEGVVFESASDSALLKGTIRIDVAGAVTAPGVYEFSFGERIDDALAKAGGLSNDADAGWIDKNLNKAAKLVDGGKIYIPKIGELTNPNVKIQSSNQIQNPNTQTLGVTTGLVNINTASQSELEALVGVGPVTAGKIIASRPYGTVEELKTKKVVGDALFEKLKDLITTM